jgi:hypothetical protein
VRQFQPRHAFETIPILDKLIVEEFVNNVNRLEAVLCDPITIKTKPNQNTFGVTIHFAHV